MELQLHPGDSGFHSLNLGPAQSERRRRSADCFVVEKMDLEGWTVGLHLVESKNVVDCCLASIDLEMRNCILEPHQDGLWHLGMVEDMYRTL